MQRNRWLTKISYTMKQSMPTENSNTHFVSTNNLSIKALKLKQDQKTSTELLKHFLSL